MMAVVAQPGSLSRSTLSRILDQALDTVAHVLVRVRGAALGPRWHCGYYRDHAAQPLEPRSGSDPTENHWVQWAFFIAAIMVIVMVVLVGTAAKKPWILALF